ncbi:hypothetical protein [Peristeroidobacter agariperforans]|nr:hypothetical protein [Peristeroidobacter agariperforans]
MSDTIEAGSAEDRSHPPSDASMLELIEHYRAQIEVNGVSAVVKFIGAN